MDGSVRLKVRICVVGGVGGVGGVGVGVVFVWNVFEDIWVAVLGGG